MTNKLKWTGRLLYKQAICSHTSFLSLLRDEPGPRAEEVVWTC